LRKLPRGSSLARLLAGARGVRNVQAVPPLTESQIAEWARRHMKRHGRHPLARSGPIEGTAGETWCGIDNALREGSRGLPGGDTLALFLARRLGVRTLPSVPPLTVATIRAWAEAHRQRTGSWPKVRSGAVADAPGETWGRIERALSRGQRGLPGGSTLARLLRPTSYPTRTGKPDLTEAQILEWADRHKERTGRWPTRRSGPVLDAEGETWAALSHALYQGFRGLPAGDNLFRLLQRERGATRGTSRR
jgi:hypothetical protein